MRVAWLSLIVALGGCGRDHAAPAVGAFGAPIQLATLPPTDADHPYNNTVEPSIAAHDGSVVVAFIALHLDDGSFDLTNMSDFRKQVATSLSTDDGATFAPSQQISQAVYSTDPVLVVGASGRFWLSLHDDGTNLVNLYASTDGMAWTETASNGPNGDKQWLALDEAMGRVFVANSGGFAMFGTDGSALSTAIPGAQMTAAYADVGGVHLMTASDATMMPMPTVMHWDGTTMPVQEGQPLPAGDAATFYTMTSSAMGATADGGQWIVRGTQSSDGTAAIVARVRHLPDEGSDVQVSDHGAIAFLPAAAMDAEGRLHVVYYDSSGGHGRLLYRRSKAADLAAGFEPAIVVDENACPPGFYPFYSTPMGGRRLREYISIAIDGNRVHVAWTHAPTAPSQVYTAHADF